jgi:glucose/arabinose dehydrogenase
MERPTRRSTARTVLGWVAWGAVLLLALAWAFAYYSGGVTPGFILAAIRGRLAPARTPADVTAPAGVVATAWASGIDNPTALAFGRDGALYVATLGGEVLALRDADGDGVIGADERLAYATGLSSPLGLAFDGTDLYVGQRGGVLRLRDTDNNGRADEFRRLIQGLPASRHQTNGVVVGPDGRLYIGQGSNSDRGETRIEPREASVLVAERDGTGLSVFASGTRNPYGLAFYPGTRELFATDNGRDVPASGVPDEVNHIVAGEDYGWPDCWGRGQGRNCAGTRPPAALLPEHSAAGGLFFYTGSMFPEWHNHLFVALYGANSGDPDIGRRVVRIELERADDGWTGTVHEFAGGFNRPLAVAGGPDGAIYVADFAAGIIYRLSR